ncbi:MAG: hypothetical protein ACK5JS_02010 [Mangrovibacterium sp.]
MLVSSVLLKRVPCAFSKKNGVVAHAFKVLKSYFVKAGLSKFDESFFDSQSSVVISTSSAVVTF